MKLADYIKDIGPKKASELFGISSEQCYQYMNLVHIPKPATARKIKELTNGLVDYADCYDPYFNHHAVDDEMQLKFDM